MWIDVGIHIVGSMWRRSSSVTSVGSAAAERRQGAFSGRGQKLGGTKSAPSEQAYSQGKADVGGRNGQQATSVDSSQASMRELARERAARAAAERAGAILAEPSEASHLGPALASSQELVALEEMGFESEKAKAALVASNGNLELAIELLNIK